jgi:ribonuclease E
MAPERDTVTAAPPPVEAPIAVAAAMPMVVESVQPRPAPVAEAAVPIAAAPVVVAAPPPPPPAPPADLDSALRDSGLVMIQTKADRVTHQVDVEQPPAPRPRRERRAPPPDLNAPLMQVETARKSDTEAPPQ